MCRVISTQVVEAGVDLDFPVVYRALAGADSIAQANGRCNREGQLDCGQMFLFDPAEGQTWVKDLRNGIQVLNGMEKAGLLDWDDPGIFKEYFTRAYKSSDGGVEIENLRKKLRFEDVEKYFQWIPDGQIPVLCPFGEGAELIRTLEERPTRELMRKTQQFTVSIFRKQADELKKAGYIVPMWEVETGDPLYRAIPEAYDQQFGLI
jgi:CRISPR-associated endonuclease/helicase Cas3